jgi:hypothetical protein
VLVMRLWLNDYGSAMFKLAQFMLFSNKVNLEWLSKSSSMAHSEDQSRLLRDSADYSDEHEAERRVLTRRPTYQAVRRVLIQGPANVVFLLVPIGLAAGLSSADVRAVFILNFLALLTLAPVIAVMTRELSETAGPTIGGLLKATLCNGVEMLVCGFNFPKFLGTGFHILLTVQIIP